jgi:hypothetical protein
MGECCSFIHAKFFASQEVCRSFDNDISEVAASLDTLVDVIDSGEWIELVSLSNLGKVIDDQDLEAGIPSLLERR